MCPECANAPDEGTGKVDEPEGQSGDTPALRRSTRQRKQPKNRDNATPSGTSGAQDPQPEPVPSADPQPETPGAETAEVSVSESVYQELCNSKDEWENSQNTSWPTLFEFQRTLDMQIGEVGSIEVGDQVTMEVSKCGLRETLTACVAACIPGATAEEHVLAVLPYRYRTIRFWKAGDLTGNTCV